MSTARLHPRREPQRNFSQKQVLLKRLVSAGLFLLGTPIIGLAAWGWGFPASSGEVIPSQPWQLGSSCPGPPSEKGLRGETKRAAGAAALSPPHPLALASPTRLVPGAVLLLHPFAGPLGSSAGFQNSGSPEWVFVCGSSAGPEVPRWKCWTEMSPRGPGLRRAPPVAWEAGLCRAAPPGIRWDLDEPGAG